MTLEEQRLVATQLQQQNASSSSSGSYCPALLWTYTGTGNTMTRMLIEAASGFSTGSVYTGACCGSSGQNSASSSLWWQHGWCSSY